MVAEWRVMNVRPCLYRIARNLSLLQLCFFQAEDGIRDIGVTGVQTCALPIYALSIGSPITEPRAMLTRPLPSSDSLRPAIFSVPVRSPVTGRSAKSRNEAMSATGGMEERRGGKECRSRWSTYHYKKKIQTVTK